MTSKRNIKKHLATSHPLSQVQNLAVSQLPCCVAPLLDALRTVGVYPCVEEVDNPVIFRFYLGIVLWTALCTTRIMSG